MLRPRIIPVLLLKENCLVKSVKFKKHSYIGDPLNAVKLFNDLKVDELVFTAVQKQLGSISAEHGVGLTKKSFLHFTRSESEIQLMKQIKLIFDPDHIMNPGKVLPP